MSDDEEDAMSCSILQGYMHGPQSLRWMFRYADSIEPSNFDVLTECPDYDHIHDNEYNPSTNGPYGPGTCELCDSSGEVTNKKFKQWADGVREYEPIRLHNIEKRKTIRILKSFDKTINIK